MPDTKRKSSHALVDSSLGSMGNAVILDIYLCGQHPVIA